MQVRTNARTHTYTHRHTHPPTQPPSHPATQPPTHMCVPRMRVQIAMSRRRVKIRCALFFLFCVPIPKPRVLTKTPARRLAQSFVVWWLPRKKNWKKNHRITNKTPAWCLVQFCHLVDTREKKGGKTGDWQDSSTALDANFCQLVANRAKKTTNTGLFTKLQVGAWCNVLPSSGSSKKIQKINPGLLIKLQRGAWCNVWSFGGYSSKK